MGNENGLKNDIKPKEVNKTKTKKVKTKIKVRYSQTREIKIEGLKQIKIKSMDDYTFLNREARHNQIVSVTSMGRTLSRQHQIVLCETEKCGKIFFVELAGSERIKKSVSGQALKEAT